MSSLYLTIIISFITIDIYITTVCMCKESIVIVTVCRVKIHNCSYEYVISIELLCVQANSLNNAEESDSTPYGIVLDITLVKGQRVVTVRSPVQVQTVDRSVYTKY